MLRIASLIAAFSDAESGNQREASKLSAPNTFATN
jgi:hypothetical protein